MEWTERQQYENLKEKKKPTKQEKKNRGKKKKNSNNYTLYLNHAWSSTYVHALKNRKKKRERCKEKRNGSRLSHYKKMTKN